MNTVNTALENSHRGKGGNQFSSDTEGFVIHLQFFNAPIYFHDIHLM